MVKEEMRRKINRNVNFIVKKSDHVRIARFVDHKKFFALLVVICIFLLPCRFLRKYYKRFSRFCLNNFVLVVVTHYSKRFL